MVGTKSKIKRQKETVNLDADRLNKSPCLYSPFVTDTYIDKIIQTIDRIQFAVKNQGRTFRDVLQMLRNPSFKYYGSYPDKKDNCRIWVFFIESSRVELKQYKFVHFNFSISLHDPNKTSQSIIRDILFNFPVEYVTISEVEFAWDFYPELLSDLCLLFYNINQRLNLTYSRANSAKTCSGNGTFTKYQGKGGNIHRGTKGRRVYLRPIENPECIRAELQANRKLCKEMGLNLASLPISHDMDFFKHLEFKEGMSRKWLTKLTNAVFKKKHGKSQFLKTIREKAKTSNRKYGSAAERVMKSLIRDDIAGSVLLPKGGVFWFGEQDSIPVAEQIDRYKLLREQEDLSYQANQIFPKIKIASQGV